MFSGTAGRCHSPFQQRGAPGHSEPPETHRCFPTRRRLGGQRGTSLLSLPAPAVTKPLHRSLLPRTAPPRAARLRRGLPGPLPMAQVQLSLMALYLLPDASFCSFRRISSILPPPGSSRSRGSSGAGGEQEEGGAGGRAVPGCPRRRRAYAGTVCCTPLPPRRR